MIGDTKSLIAYADSLSAEAVSRQAETGMAEAETNTRFLRGEQFPAFTALRDQEYRFVMNVIYPTLLRHVALLTDSKPQINVVPRRRNRTGTATIYKNTIGALWDESNFEQLSARELVRAGTVGSTCCVPMWDQSAGFGHGQIVFPMFDPRQVRLDPTVVHAVDVQERAEYMQIIEIVALNAVRERYPLRGWNVQPTMRWSRYGTSKAQVSLPGRSIMSPLQQPWRGREEPAIESEVPRVELRHTWFKDYVRDEKGQPERLKPRHVRYMVDAENTILKDERLVYAHGQIPCHLFDWGIEFEHPFGIPMVTGLRRMQYTLNRIIGQVMQNIIMTNRVKVVSDANAVDPKTWDAITQNRQGIYVKKRQGHTFNYELPNNVVPAYIINVVQLLLSGMQQVTGLDEGLAGRAPKNLSGVAIDALATNAQSVIRLYARNFESWLERTFQQVLALIWQYYDSDRLLHIVGPGKELMEFEFNRQQFLRGDNGLDYSPHDAESLWQDFEFRIVPGSSLAMTRVQKGVIALNLYQAGLLPGVEVLKATEWPNPEETFEEAKAEFAAGGGPGQRASRKMMRLPNSTRSQQVGV